MDGDVRTYLQPEPADTGLEMRCFAVPGLPEIRAGDDLTALIGDALVEADLALRDGDVLVLAQKIVSKAEGAVINLSCVEIGAEARHLAAETGKDPAQIQAVLDQSRRVIRKRPGVVIVEDIRGFVLANAGLDASNLGRADGALLALPADPDASAEALRSGLSSRFGANIGVVINDSWGRPFRLGSVGHAIGVAGIEALSDRCGDPDRDGRELQATHVAVADELAAAGSLLMGAGAEGRPAIVIRGSGVQLSSLARAQDLLRPAEQDLFREGPQ